MTSHKTSGDHDSRYYTEDEVNAKILVVQNRASASPNFFSINQTTTLNSFVEITATDKQGGFARVKDTNNIFGLGANRWYRIWYSYQNAYGSQYDSQGFLFMQTDGTYVYLGFVSGTTTKAFSYVKLN